MLDIEPFTRETMTSTTTTNITLIGNPTAQARARVVRNGKFIRAYSPCTPEKQLYIDQLRLYNGKCYNVPIEVEATFYLKIPKSVRRLVPSVKPDVDNLWKSLDICNRILWLDDALIVKLTLTKKYVNREGFTVISIMEARY